MAELPRILVDAHTRRENCSMKRQHFLGICPWIKTSCVSVPALKQVSGLFQYMYFLWHEPISVLFPFIAGCSAFHEDEQHHEHCRQLPPRSRPWEPETEGQLWRGFDTGWSNCSRRCSQNIQRRLAVGALPGSSFLAIIHWSGRSGLLPKEWGVTRYCKLIALIFAALCTLLDFISQCSYQ